ncbi:MAG: hypothetical protein Q8J88_11295 [Bacteroidales bacterium]|jgi:hypothetical protein|nr:hypothetical protein [Bacteroidales bacterium]
MDEERKLINDVNETIGFDITNIYKSGLIEIKQLRKWVVKEKYFSLAKTGRTYTDIKNQLSEEYNVSISVIEKMIYRK